MVLTPFLVFQFISVSLSLSFSLSLSLKLLFTQPTSFPSLYHPPTHVHTHTRPHTLTHTHTHANTLSVSSLKAFRISLTIASLLKLSSIECPQKNSLWSFALRNLFLKKSFIFRLRRFFKAPTKLI